MPPSAGIDGPRRDAAQGFGRLCGNALRSHADVFDNVLVDQLHYCVPLLVRQRIQALGLGPFKRVLDLGCGTG